MSRLTTPQGNLFLVLDSSIEGIKPAHPHIEADHVTIAAMERLTPEMIGFLKRSQRYTVQPIAVLDDGKIQALEVDITDTKLHDLFEKHPNKGKMAHLPKRTHITISHEEDAAPKDSIALFDPERNDVQRTELKNVPSLETHLQFMSLGELQEKHHTALNEAGIAPEDVKTMAEYKESRTSRITNPHEFKEQNPER